MSKTKEALLIVVFVCLILVMMVAIAAAASPSDEANSYDSPPHKALDQLAEEYAQQMADIQSQSRGRDGHFGWDVRRRKALAATGGSYAAEISAETWPGQSNLSWEDQWEEFAKDWRQSRGQGGGANHWSIAGVKHKWIGTGSACGRNGTWYGCLIAVD